MTAPSSWSPLLASFILLLVLYWVSRRLAQSFVITFYLLTRSENAATSLYILFVLPGTLIHETSHWLMAQLVGVKTGNVTVLPKFQRKGPIRLGSVDVRGGNLLQLTLVGIAPFLVGGFLTVWVSYGLIDFETLHFLWRQFSFSNLLAVIQQVIYQPDSVLGLYLLFIVSDAMFLSASDVTSLRQFLIYTAIAMAVLLGLGGLPTQLPTWTSFIVVGSQLLATGLAVALTVHVALWATLAVLRFILGLFWRP
ncbi:MAG: hypothetical protein GXP37_08610 [Chloroflexi bacterium]|nr:hypothetical protein [Chloroflexota bacterium]